MNRIIYPRPDYCGNKSYYPTIYLNCNDCKNGIIPTGVVNFEISIQIYRDPQFTSKISLGLKNGPAQKILLEKHSQITQYMMSLQKSRTHYVEFVSSNLDGGDVKNLLDADTDAYYYIIKYRVNQVQFLTVNFNKVFQKSAFIVGNFSDNTFSNDAPLTDYLKKWKLG